MFPYPAKSAFAEIAAVAREKLAAEGVANARFSLQIKIHPHTTQGGVEKLPGVKNIIAVASAKGGVGKSTTAANIALALAQEGGAVGILDADIYGPSLPVMLGVYRRPQGGDTGGIAPVMSHGIALMSIGFMVGEDQPMVWRGPMATRALVQLLRETICPPGTGDIQLTIAQTNSGNRRHCRNHTARIGGVGCTPRLGHVRAKLAFRYWALWKIWGCNHCPHCGHDSHYFRFRRCAKNVRPLRCGIIGRIALDAAIRDAADGGAPSVVSAPDGDIAKTLSPHRRASGG